MVPNKLAGLDVPLDAAIVGAHSMDGAAVPDAEVFALCELAAVAGPGDCPAFDDDVAPDWPVDPPAASPADPPGEMVKVGTLNGS